MSISHSNQVSDIHDISVPLADIMRAELIFSRGASLVSLAAEAGLDALLQAHFEGPAPRFNVSGGTITLDYERLSLAAWARYALLWGRFAGNITLNAAFPWAIAVRGGVSKVNGDLRTLSLSSFTISGGASEVTLDLPQPSGVVMLRIIGGASNILLRRPAHSAARVAVRGGSSRLTLDEQHFGGIGGNTQLETPGASLSRDRYEIMIEGGASNLTVERW